VQVGFYQALPGGIRLLISGSEMLNATNLFFSTQWRNFTDLGHIDLYGVVRERVIVVQVRAFLSTNFSMFTNFSGSSMAGCNRAWSVRIGYLRRRPNSRSSLPEGAYSRTQ
jgi:hypothetical protein